MIRMMFGIIIIRNADHLTLVENKRGVEILPRLKGTFHRTGNLFQLFEINHFLIEYQVIDPPTRQPQNLTIQAKNKSV